MRARKHKQMCRLKVELYSKVLKYMAVILTTYFMGMLSWEVFVITTVWMTSGDISAYILESIYHIRHNLMSHR